ncbi:hypothetical protein HYW74_02125 [Candidatus Pacearchaeota archaeon]|nr:hypothetical protein [Candidatus Pacearchaeota archaeon]
MITYNDIYEALRKERYSEQLQPLPKKFIQEFSDYIKEKKITANQTGDYGSLNLFSDEIAKVKKQLENATAIFNELMLLRKKKLLGLVFVASETGISKRDFENMLEFEKEMFDKLIESVQDAEKKLAVEINNNSYDNGNSDLDKELKLILFLEDIDELVGLNGEALGPFKKDEIVNLPKQVADILISDKKAEVVLEE